MRRFGGEGVSKLVLFIKYLLYVYYIMWLLLQQFYGDTPASICATAQGFETGFTLMPENTFGFASTFKKMQQNFAEMAGPEESQVTLSK